MNARFSCKMVVGDPKYAGLEGEPLLRAVGEELLTTHADLLELFAFMLEVDPAQLNFRLEIERERTDVPFHMGETVTVWAIVSRKGAPLVFEDVETLEVALLFTGAPFRRAPDPAASEARPS